MWARVGTRSDALMASPSEPRRRMTRWVSCAGRSLRASCAATWSRKERPTKLAALAERALPVFQVACDDVALFIGYWALGAVSHMHAQNDAAVEAYDWAAIYAERAGLGPKLLGERATCRLLRHNTCVGSAGLARRAGAPNLGSV